MDQLVTQIADCNIHFMYKFRKLFLPFRVFYMYTVCAPCRALSIDLDLDLDLDLKQTREFDHAHSLTSMQ